MYSQRRNFSKLFLIVIFLITAFLVRDGISSEPYPNRPITVVYGFGAGGMADTILRILCKAAEKELGQPIIVENKPGAGGTIGTNYVLKSNPDGYTLGMLGTGHYTIHPHMKKLPYNPLTDVLDIVPVFRYNYGINVRKDAPWNTFEDIIVYSKNNPGKFAFATAGIGLSQHICMERIAMKEKIKWTHIPFKSGPESVLACLGRNADATVQGSADVLPYIEAGKLKLVLAIDEKRWKCLPNVPNIYEKGYDFSAITYFAISGPKGIPESILKKIEGAFGRAKKDPSFIQTLERFKLDEATMSAKEYEDFWRREYYAMEEVIKTLGLQAK
jgi:tripartite-type tricarboxylate transporter receptor subunit TctC